MEAALEALRALRLAEPGIGVKPLVAKLKEQRLDLEVGAKEVREMVRKLDEEHGGVLGDAAVAMQAAMVSMIKDSRKWLVLQWASFVVYGLPAFEVHSSGVAAALDAESAVPGGLTSMNGGLPSEDAPQEPFLLDEHGDPCWVVAQEQQQLRALKHQRPTRTDRPFSAADWAEAVASLRNDKFKVQLGKYFASSISPQREYWIQYKDDEAKPFLVLHIHFPKPPAGAADRTPPFHLVTSVNARFSRGDSEPGRYNQFMRRSIESEGLRLTGGHPSIDSVASNAHEMGDYSEVDGHLPLGCVEVTLGTGKPWPGQVWLGPPRRLDQEQQAWLDGFDFYHLFGLHGTGATIDVRSVSRPGAAGGVAMQGIETRVNLRIDLLPIADLNRRVELFDRLQVFEINHFIGTSDFKLLGRTLKHVPRTVGWDFERHLDAAGVPAYPPWPPPAHEEIAAVATAADLRDVLMHVEAERRRHERPIPPRYYEEWERKARQSGPKPTELGDKWRHDG